MKNFIFPAILTAVAATGFFMKNDQSKSSTRINHIALHVTDLKKSTAFYRDVIGLDVVPNPFSDTTHAWLPMGDHSSLHLIAGAPAKANIGKHTHFSFSVGSLDQFIQKLEKFGVKYGDWNGTSKTPTLRPDGIKQVYFQDPDGYWLEVNDDNK